MKKVIMILTGIVFAIVLGKLVYFDTLKPKATTLTTKSEEKITQYTTLIEGQ